MTTIAIVGFGDLGATIAEALIHEPLIDELVVATRDVARAERRVNVIRLAGAMEARCPAMRVVRMDLTDESQAAETLHREAPNIALCAATRLTWRAPDLLPDDHATRLRRVPFGMWLPAHLDPAIRFMKAVHAAGRSIQTLMAPYPDVVNVALAGRGLTPTGGIGNVDEMVPLVRMRAAQRLGEAAGSVDVRLIAHHALQPFVFGAQTGHGPPFIVRVYARDQDVTERAGGERIVSGAFPLAAGRTTHYLTAASTARLVRALLSDTPTPLHVPGPQGLPGGYPVHVATTGVALRLPPDVDRAAAVAVNAKAHRWDGIDEIGPGGEIRYTPEATEAMHEALGYACERLAPDEVERRANELTDRFWALARRHGVSTP